MALLLRLVVDLDAAMDGDDQEDVEDEKKQEREDEADGLLGKEDGYFDGPVCHEIQRPGEVEAL